MSIKKIILSFVVLTIVVVIGDSFAETEPTDSAQRPTVVSIYGTDEIPPPEMLAGYRNKSNTDSREGFYTRKEYLLQNHLMQKLSTEEKINTKVKIDELDIIKFFGTDFPIEKQKNLSQIYRTMQEEIEKIRELYDEGKISDKKYKRLFFKIAEESLKSYADILTDEEFKIRFGIKKNEIESSTRELLNYDQ